MRPRVIAFLTVTAAAAAAAGCSSQSGGAAATATDGGGGAAGDDAGGAGGGEGGEQGPPTPVWTSYASRGKDSRWGVPLAYSTKSATFLGFGGAQFPQPTATGTFALSMATGAWTQLTDSSEPTPSYCSCTAYLPDQDQVLLFGGLSDGGPLGAKAWTLDVASGAWTALQGTLPAGGIGCTVTWMPALKKAIVFGGLSPTAYSADTWSYDPVARTFTKLTPAASPPARADAIAAYDPGEGGRMLVFAGTQNEEQNTGHRNDLWAFDGTTWTELQPSGGPPPPRRVAAGGFDPVRRRWVVFGGTVETSDLGDLWMLDVASLTWTQLPSAGAPPARGFASAGYDPGTDSYFVVGGLQQPSDVTVADGWKLTLK